MHGVATRLDVNRRRGISLSRWNSPSAAWSHDARSCFLLDGLIPAASWSSSPSFNGEFLSRDLAIVGSAFGRDPRRRRRRPSCEDRRRRCWLAISWPIQSVGKNTFSEREITYVLRGSRQKKKTRGFEFDQPSVFRAFRSEGEIVFSSCGDRGDECRRLFL